VDPRADAVELDGARVEAPPGQWTLALNKPAEVLVAARDGRGRRTVMDLLEDAPGRVFPVGRLDYRSQGLLLLTNDGDLAFRLAHPRYKVDKCYHVDVAGPLPPGALRALRDGVLLDDGPTLPARVRVLDRDGPRQTLEISLREGRKRQVRRMLALFGAEVLRLERVRFGPVELGELPPGQWRALSGTEVLALRHAVGLA
jgi:pseudouridine synthase